MSDAREILQAAIAARNAENLIYEATATALGRARDLLDTTKRDLAGYDDLDVEINEHRISAVREALAAGDGLPVLDALPKRLADRRDARDAVAERLGAIELALGALEKEAEAQRKKVSDASLAVEQAAEVVLIAEADEIAAKFDEALTTARKLWLDLQSISRIQTSRTAGDGAVPALYGVIPRQRPVRIPESAQAALAQRIDVEGWELRGGGGGAGKAAQSRWDSRWRELLA